MHGIQEQLEIAAGTGMTHANRFASLPLDPEQPDFREKMPLAETQQRQG